MRQNKRQGALKRKQALMKNQCNNNLQYPDETQTILCLKINDSPEAREADCSVSKATNKRRCDFSDTMPRLRADTLRSNLF